jgi:hypothetical protein
MFRAGCRGLRRGKAASSLREPFCTFSCPKEWGLAHGSSVAPACTLKNGVSRPADPKEVRSFLMRWLAILAGMAVLSGGAEMALAQAEQPSAAERKSATAITLPPSPKALLPDAFDGWVTAEPSKAVTDPAQADTANAEALKEYGFNAAVLANYKREGGTLSLRALRFNDASGAYGAYTYYRQNGWPKESIGTGAASDNNRVIFWVGSTVVDATFSHVGPMSAGELREIARQLPVANGSGALLPPILVSLPQSRLEPQTTHYAVGPASYAGAGGVLPPSLVSFDKGAESLTANYSLASGPATLTLIDYPTPQIAHAQVDAIRAYLKAGNKAQPPWTKPLNDSDVASLEVRDSGPLVVVVSGDAVPDESHRLLESVHYEADVTAIPQPVESEIEKTGKLLLGITVISVIGAAAAILLGGFLGGGRALYRMARGKPASTIFDEEFIYLNLREKVVYPDLPEEADENSKANQGPHPKG